MRTPARGPFRAFLALSDEFARHPDYRWYPHSVLSNLSQLLRRTTLASMRNELHRLCARKGTLSAVAGSLFRKLPVLPTRIDGQQAPISLPVTEWVVFKACVYAMVTVMTIERSELWMRRFDRICANLIAHPQYMDQLEGRTHCAVEFVRIAKAHVQFRCYCQTTKRALNASYLRMCMRTMDSTEPRGTCSICMKTVCKRHTRLPCGHTYHKVCMLRWLCRATQATCPVCRRSLDV